VAHSSTVRPPNRTNTSAARTAAIGQLSSARPIRESDNGHTATRTATTNNAARCPDIPNRNATRSRCHPKYVRT